MSSRRGFLFPADCVPVFSRSTVHDLLETKIIISGCRKTAFHRNIGDAHISIGQKADALFDADMSRLRQLQPSGGSESLFEDSYYTAETGAFVLSRKVKVPKTADQ